MKYAIIIPVRNGGEIWKECVEAIKTQKKLTPYIYIINSNSSDDTIDIASKLTKEIISINESDFNHGGTRNFGVTLIEDLVDIIIFLTQDAILCSNTSIEDIISSFSDPDVFAAYGRQLPHKDANPIARHARNFSYGTKSFISSLEQKKTLGLKTVFLSNSFAAYRVSKFKELSGFPENTILCEDMFLASKGVLAGYKIAYVANSTVFHSHNYSPIDEFNRYFDIGVFHHNENWIRQTFGGAGGEGKKFIISELKYLLINAPLWIPRAIVTNLFKIIGYKLGCSNNLIPFFLKKRISMHKAYWKKNHTDY
ncbi:glycosyltransferase [Acerihabitans sp. TG2]|uniref:glycosyltransferase family 2 protein n=1 Tax=Acerihabitans sp. TG2 TaxID=3096008 RepID=UPI002B226D02|nr:glycosyltransferase [Acerihabitans sp. TG2]MEA9389289.1 glycosyltransferase [Acerihabitans sp. TG2]